MRGGDLRTESLFSYVSCEATVPEDTADPNHRRSRCCRPSSTHCIAASVGRRSHRRSCSATGVVRSERQLMEQTTCCSAGFGVDDAVWDVTEEPRAAGDIATKFFQAVLDQPACCSRTSTSVSMAR